MLQSRGPSSLCLINDLAVYNGHVRLAADLVLWTADPLTTIGGEAYMTIVNGEIVYQVE